MVAADERGDVAPQHRDLAHRLRRVLLVDLEIRMHHVRDVRLAQQKHRPVVSALSPAISPRMISSRPSTSLNSARDSAGIAPSRTGSMPYRSAELLTAGSSAVAHTVADRPEVSVYQSSTTALRRPPPLNCIERVLSVPLSRPARRLCGRHSPSRAAEHRKPGDCAHRWSASSAALLRLRSSSPRRSRAVSVVPHTL
jgi:hypothetical protein